jgi:hypothetical protein
MVCQLAYHHLVFFGFLLVLEDAFVLLLVFFIVHDLFFIDANGKHVICGGLPKTNLSTHADF